MANVTDFDKQVEMQVLNHSIYVWGASGQLCKDVNEEWIRKKQEEMIAKTFDIIDNQVDNQDLPRGT